MGRESTGLSGICGDPFLPCFFTANTFPETGQALPLGSGLDNCQWAGDNRLSVGRQPWMEFWEKTHTHSGFILNLQPNTFVRAPNSGAEGAEWKHGLPQECFPLPDKAEPGTALLALLIKCQAQLSWLNVFHSRKNLGFLGSIQISEGKRFIP